MYGTPIFQAFTLYVTTFHNTKKKLRQKDFTKDPARG